MAMYAARAAQSHVGLARRLARDEDARIRRRDVTALAAKVRGVGDALGAAADLAAIAEDESGAASAERDAAERQRLMELLGVDPAARTQPPHVRSQLAGLEKEQKARATRHSRDVLDRSLVDLLSVYRDALVLHSGAQLGLVNQDSLPLVQQVARAMSPEQLLVAIEAIATARERIGLNVAPLLALESMALSLRLPA
jgi:DNA polymerase-3 subunit delta'